MVWSAAGPAAAGCGPVLWRHAGLQPCRPRLVAPSARKQPPGGVPRAVAAAGAAVPAVAAYSPGGAVGCGWAVACGLELGGFRVCGARWGLGSPRRGIYGAGLA